MLVRHFVGKPLGVAFPQVDRWWLIYVALVSGEVLTWFVALNLFEGLMPPVLGRIVTGRIVGGGSQLLYRIIEAATDLVTKWAAPMR